MTDSRSLNKNDRLPSQTSTEVYLEFLYSSIGTLWYVAKPLTFHKAQLSPLSDTWTIDATDTTVHEDCFALLIGYIRLGNWASIVLGISGHLDPYAAIFLIGEKLYGVPWQGGARRQKDFPADFFLMDKTKYSLKRILGEFLVPVQKAEDVPLKLP